VTVLVIFLSRSSALDFLRAAKEIRKNSTAQASR